MSDELKTVLAVRKASGANIAECRAILAQVGWNAEDAIEVLTRPVPVGGLGPFEGPDWVTGPPLTRRMVERAERALGFTFAPRYLELLYRQNGGATRAGCFAVDQPTSWADDHIAIDGIRGIGGKYGLDADAEKRIAAEWRYPDSGFAFALTPTAGHTAVMFDYSLCGPRGEPRVIWVDTYGESVETRVLADDFPSFLAGLVDEEALP